MAKNPNITPDVCRQLLRYERETGKLFWREREPFWFSETSNRSSNGACSIWNGRHANREAFTAVNNNGYHYGIILSCDYLAHRVILAIVNDCWPDKVDHINGTRTDNRLCNLRDVPLSENQRNMSRRRDNTSGVTGVSWHKGRGCWIAQIGGRHIGTFDTITAATEARLNASKDLGYHENHGRF